MNCQVHFCGLAFSCAHRPSVDRMARRSKRVVLDGRTTTTPRTWRTTARFSNRSFRHFLLLDRSSWWRCVVVVNKADDKTTTTQRHYENASERGVLVHFGPPARFTGPMSERPIDPTDAEREAKLGRVALWLDPADLEWLSRHCCCPDDASTEQMEWCGRLRFRAHAALHKVGLTAPEIPQSDQAP